MPPAPDADAVRQRACHGDGTGRNCTADGTDVYRLKTIASVRTDVNAMFPDTVLPQCVERRFGIKSASKMRNGFFEPYGMEVCVISVRKDEGPVIKRTGIMVP